MSWLYAQTWLWYLIAFAVGVLLAWLLLVRPQQRRLRTLQGLAGAGVDHDLYVESRNRLAGAALFDSARGASAASTAEPTTEQIPVVDPAGGSQTTEIPVQPPPDDSVTGEIPVVPGAEAARASEAEAPAGVDSAGDSGTASSELVPSEPVPSESAPAESGASDPGSSEPISGATEAEPAPATTGATNGAAAAQTGPDAVGPAADGSVAPKGLLTVPAGVTTGPYHGSARPGPDGAAPSEEFTIKGNEDSMLFHTPDSPYYGRTKAEVWFSRVEDAEAAGFTNWKRRK